MENKDIVVDEKKQDSVDHRWTPSVEGICSECGRHLYVNTLNICLSCAEFLETLQEYQAWQLKSIEKSFNSGKENSSRLNLRLYSLLTSH